MTPAQRRDAERLCPICAAGLAPAAVCSGDRRIGWVHPLTRSPSGRVLRPDTPCAAAEVWEADARFLALAAAPRIEARQP